MNIVFAKENISEPVNMKDIYCKTIQEAMEENGNVVALDADLMNSIGLLSVQKAFPERTINCGIQEANMVGVAAGLSATGKIPFASTFATFASRRAYDQLFISAGFAKLNIRLIGSDPGIFAAFNGGTHMSFEDIGILRNVPDITIIEPVDSVMLRDILKQLVSLCGVFYVRLIRQGTVKIYEEGSAFEIGKAVRIREGKDITIIASGIGVADSLEACKQLSEKGISARVLNMFTIKPIDKEAIIQSANDTGAIVTVENHNIINGLGSAVAEVLAENAPVPMERVGVNDVYGEVGSVEYLKKRFELTPEDIVKKSELVLSRKKSFTSI